MDSSVTTVCFRCHYDLRVTPDDQPCPECGLLAGRSRRATDELRDARPKWLRSLCIGVWLILAAMAVTILADQAGEIAFSLLRRLFPPPGFVRITAGGFVLPSPAWSNIDRWRSHVLLAGWYFATGLLLVGAVLMTRPEGYKPADQIDRKRRRWIRMAALMPLIADFISAMMSPAEYWFVAEGREERNWITSFIITVGCIPLPLLLFGQFKCLANRAGSRHLSDHCSIVGVGTSCTLLLVFCFFIVQHVMLAVDANWMRRATGSSLVCMVAVLTPTILFILWSLYLMIRFAISFGRAARESRRAWLASDRANAVN